MKAHQGTGVAWHQEERSRVSWPRAGVHPRQGLRSRPRTFSASSSFPIPIFSWALLSSWQMGFGLGKARDCTSTQALRALKERGLELSNGAGVQTNPPHAYPTRVLSSRGPALHISLRAGAGFVLGSQCDVSKFTDFLFPTIQSKLSRTQAEDA